MNLIIYLSPHPTNFLMVAVLPVIDEFITIKSKSLSINKLPSAGLLANFFVFNPNKSTVLILE